MVEPEYIVVQAGGMGTRLGQHTVNKPKALVSIDNLPMIFHLFRKYPDKRFVIIGDYRADVLSRYLQTFSKVKYILVGTDGNKGTCSGINNALQYIPDGSSFLLTWCDVILDDVEIPSMPGNLIGLSRTHPCRWMYADGVFTEESNNIAGVAGVFVFENKDVLRDVPDSGEFVRWLKDAAIEFSSFYLDGYRECGTLDTLGIVQAGRCRPFNSITHKGGYIIKEGIDDQGRGLAVREKAWYRYVSRYDDVAIPNIISFEPLTMELIDGKNIFQYDLTQQERNRMLDLVVESLSKLHAHDIQAPDPFSLKDAYFTKTVKRLDSIRNLIPHADEPLITINGKSCRNVFFNMDSLEKRLSEISCNRFCLIHGDCTFSNMMLKGGLPVLIDPRGYFGYTELFGDPLYDWAKLYYSVVGNYDQFNLRRFKLTIGEQVELNIDSNGWEDMGEALLEKISDECSADDVKLIHAIIWLSLTTYAWDDYDSICGAFYNGLYHLEDVL